MKKVRILVALTLIATLLLAGSYQSQAASGERYFPETGHAIKGAFQAYWEQHGGLERFGYPLSDELSEVSDLNGQTYTVQYFERAEFEHHPENAAPYDVLLTQLGTLRLKELYPRPQRFERMSNDSPTLFPQTGKHVGRLLLNAWQRLGGLADIGYPISEEIGEKSPLDGNIYLVQYFERAEFEYHPDNQPPYDVLLTQLGRFAYTEKHGPKPTPTATPDTGSAHLNIPATASDRDQRFPSISDRYLVWQDVPAQFTNGAPISDTRLLAMDLSSSSVQTVYDHYCGTYRPVVAGSVVAWAYDPANDCYTFHARLAAKDLATGTTYDLAPEAQYYSEPAIAGHTVVWSGANYSIDNSQGSWLSSFNLDTAQRTTIVSYPYSATSQIMIGRPFINDGYIVWTEATPASGPHNIEPGAAWLKEYNRSSGVITTIQTAANTLYTIVGLDGSRIVWINDDWNRNVSLNLIDLASGTTTTLYQDPNIHYWQNTTFSGDTVVWAMEAPGHGDDDLFGLKLTDPRPLPLVVMGGNQNQPTIAGDSLVWEDDTDAGSRLNSASLNYLFATAAQRQRELQFTPTPLPTPVPTDTP